MIKLVLNVKQASFLFPYTRCNILNQFTEDVCDSRLISHATKVEADMFVNFFLIIRPRPDLKNINPFS